VRQRLVWAAVVAAALGAFLPWTSDGPVRLDGIEGPNNGWLVVIVAAFAAGWIRSMQRGSWLGVIGVLGAAVVIGGTALESWLGDRAVTGARPAFGLVLVLAASVALAASAVGCAVAASSRAGDEPTSGSP
jgi:hypothetical protein